MAVSTEHGPTSIIDALSKAAVADDLWGYHVTRGLSTSAMKQAREDQRLCEINNSSQVAQAAAAKAASLADPHSSHLSSSASNRRSHLEWASPDTYASAAQEQLHRDSLNSAVNRGGRNTESVIEKEMKAVALSESARIGPHCCPDMDDVGSYLVRNTMADFLASSRHAYSVPAATTTRASLLPTADAEQAAQAQEQIRELSLALHQTFSELSRYKQELALQTSRAAALQIELAEERANLRKSSEELVRMQRATKEADDEFVKKSAFSLHLQKATEARAAAAEKRVSDAESQIQSLKLQREGLESRLGIKGSDDSMALQAKVRRHQALCHLCASVLV